MRTIRELTKEIQPLIDNGFEINNKYEVGTEYGYKKVGGNTLLITMKNIYVSKEDGGYRNMNKDVINKAFNALTRKIGAVMTAPPINTEIGYEDGLRWLYHHYPWGEGNFSNTVLVNSKNRILAVQYNNVEYTRMIQIDTPVDKGYIIFNNKKKWEGRCYYNNFTELVPMLKELFFTT